MSGFEVLFSFASLLFGLAIANLATGYAEVWRGRSERSIGPLTLLLGAVLVINICAQWLSLWSSRESLGANTLTIYTALLVAAPYVFLSHAMFPRPGDNWGSHDDYYLGHRRTLLGVLLISPLISLAYNLLLSEGVIYDLHFFAYYIVAIGMPAALIATGRRWLHIAGLACLSLYLFGRTILIFG